MANCSYKDVKYSVYLVLTLYIAAKKLWFLHFHFLWIRRIKWKNVSVEFD